MVYDVEDNFIKTFCREISKRQMKLMLSPQNIVSWKFNTLYFSQFYILNMHLKHYLPWAGEKAYS